MIDRVQLPKLSIAHQVICWCRICNPAWNRNKKRAAYFYFYISLVSKLNEGPTESSLCVK